MPTHTFCFYHCLTLLFHIATLLLSTSAVDHRLRRNLITRRLETLASSASPPLPSFLHSPQTPSPISRVFHVSDYGADPTGTNDSTAAITRALSAASNFSSHRLLMPTVPDFGGAELHLDGGTYLISTPLSLPSSGAGNLKIHSGTLRASPDFPADRYIIELKSPDTTYAYEYITLAGLMVDVNFRGGGIAVINSLRTLIDGCYIVHFTTDGVLVQGGHETFIRNCYIGQHVTSGGDPGERNFTGTGVRLNGNDNSITDIVIFSAAVGILITGQSNTITGVHCYNKATQLGGTGIYVKLAGPTQTRITNCYMDFTGVVAEDPVQLLVSGSFFLGNANVAFKSVKGVIKEVTVVDNLFTGSGGGTPIVWLDVANGPFTDVDQVMVDRNSVSGMVVKSTVGRGSMESKGTTWTVDFSSVLLFPNRIDQVQYSLMAASGFPGHALRSVEGNKVMIESNTDVTATVHVEVGQYVGP